MTRKPLGGVIHSYQKYNPAEFPSPLAEPPDLVSPAMEHYLLHGSWRELTEEELARAIHLDPRQIANLGPSINALMETLRERKRRILETYETDTVQEKAANAFQRQAREIDPPRKLAKRWEKAVREEQIYDMEQLWYASGDERGEFALGVLNLMERLGDKYQVDELAAKYEFIGRQSMTVPEALEIKRELEKIDELLKQLEEAAKTAQICIIDMDALSEFTEPGDIDQLSALQQQIQDYMRELAERQGLEQAKNGGFRMTPKALRLFQSKLLSRIFSQLQASRTGRHTNTVVGEGATELTATKPYEFGDSIANIDAPTSLTNALIRGGTPVRMKTEDIVIHRTRNTPKCATAVVMDMSGSMRYEAQYVNVKKMALALEGLVRSEYPGDHLSFFEMFTFAKQRHASELAELMPKPVTIYDPIVRLKADMSNPNVSEFRIPPHFTNIQHGLHQARRVLGAQDTPNRQIMLITDGLPTAHFEGEMLYLLYPPDPQTTLREGQLCAREGITINLFLLSNWNQSEEDVQFAYKLAESTKGRVFFVAGRELDRYVVWDYLERRKQIIA
jgi:uncharacterized protein with von Willebrand factor type A (vWA) domain